MNYEAQVWLVVIATAGIMGVSCAIAFVVAWLSFRREECQSNTPTRGKTGT